MEKEKRFRILNKTAKTVTVKVGDQTVTSSWEEFNQNFIVVDKVWAVFNEEMKKKQDEIEDLLGFLTVYVLEMNVAKNQGNAEKVLEVAFKVGSLMEKLQKVSGFTNLQIMQLVRQRLMVMNPFMVNPMFPVTGKQKKLRKKYNVDANTTVHPAVVEENKTTIGDACPGLAALKEKMEKGEITVENTTVMTPKE